MKFGMKKRLLVVRRREPFVGGQRMRRRVMRYAECKKNHAASIGGYAVDGCREFMADGEEGTTTALRCAACGCHRNFHHKVQEYESTCECAETQ